MVFCSVMPALLPLAAAGNPRSFPPCCWFILALAALFCLTPPWSRQPFLNVLLPCSGQLRVSDAWAVRAPACPGIEEWQAEHLACPCMTRSLQHARISCPLVLPG